MSERKRLVICTYHIPYADLSLLSSEIVHFVSVVVVCIVRPNRVSNSHQGYIPKNKSVRVCACSTNLGFSVDKIVLVLVWGTSERLVPAKKKQNACYQRALRCQLRGRPFHPWAGRPRFSGAATLTQSSSFSCGAGLQSESRLLLCCAPAVYMLAADEVL